MICLSSFPRIIYMLSLTFYKSLVIKVSNVVVPPAIEGCCWVVIFEI